MQPAPAHSDHADTLEHRSARVAEMMTRYLGEHVMHGFDDDDVTEIYVNPQDGLIRFDTRSQGKVSTKETIDAQRIEQFLNAVADLHGLALGGDHPSLQAELPLERFRGARLQGFLPPMAAGASFIVRKPPSVIYLLGDYVERGILSGQGREILGRAVEEHWNILIAGGTGSGKWKGDPSQRYPLSRPPQSRTHAPAVRAARGWTGFTLPLLRSSSEELRQPLLRTRATRSSYISHEALVDARLNDSALWSGCSTPAHDRSASAKRSRACN